MKVKFSKISRILIVLMLLADDVLAIKCYQCSSVYDQNCDTLKTERIDRLMVDCDKYKRNNLTATFCRSIYQKCEPIFISFCIKNTIFLQGSF